MDVLVRSVVILLTCLLCVQQNCFVTTQDYRRSPNRSARSNRTLTTSVDQVFQRQDAQRLDTDQRGRSCNTEQIEYQLGRLETQVVQKVDVLRGEMRECNRRLQSLEYQSGQIQRTVEGFRAGMGRSSSDQQPLGRLSEQGNNNGVEQLEKRLDSLAKAVQLSVVGLRLLSDDFKLFQRNMSILTSLASNILENQHHMVTKQFLVSRLQEPRHHSGSDKVQTRHHPSSSLTTSIPRSCKEIKENSNNTASGIFRVQPEGSKEPFMVVCDMDTNGGGWTYIHNRFDGSQDFYLDWQNYKHGFGNLGGEFWLGLEYIYQLTGHELNELLIELVDHDDVKKSAHYSAFSIGSELEGYRLKALGGYTGDSGDSLTYHAGAKFSTKDMDHDDWLEGSCAQSHDGAWWYKSCDTANLNGKYLNGPIPENYVYKGMYWGKFRGPEYSLSKARMMIRPVNENHQMIPQNNGDGQFVRPN